MIQFSVYHMSSGRLRKAKHKWNFQTFSCKKGYGPLWEVVLYKRFQILWFNLKFFGFLENWKLRTGGRNWIKVRHQFCLKKHQKQFSMGTREINLKFREILPTKAKFHHQFRFISLLKSFMWTSKLICFQHLMLLKIISFEKILKTVAQKFATM